MRRFAVAAAMAVALIAIVIPEAVWAEAAWVRGAPLNLRRGAGTEFKIVGTVPPGDRIDILTRGDGWTRVKTEDGRTGWIAAGYLDAAAPPAKRLALVETEAERLGRELETATSEVERLKASYDEVSGRDTEQRDELGRLTQENAKLRAGSVWVERLTGALILCLGMALGAIWHRASTKNRGSRLRL